MVRRAALFRGAARLAAALLLTMGLSACAIPPAISLVSLAADGVLLAATGKSKTDHGLSLATGKDCNTFRAIEGEDICQDEVVAQIEPLPTVVARDLDGLRSAAPAAAGTETAMAAAFRAEPGGRAEPPLLLASAPRPMNAADLHLATAPRPAPAVQVAAAPKGVAGGAGPRQRVGATPGLVKVAAGDLVRSGALRKASLRKAAAKRGPALVRAGGKGKGKAALAAKAATKKLAAAKTRKAAAERRKASRQPVAAKAKPERVSALKPLPTAPPKLAMAAR
ncbi:hypothetical protein [Magnetospirillum sp. UT-4]|uniref:hypothetical protein n=1 Tax=Magnetospirillum sp. UT-4 TaxID=2681467 RepID=UPI0015743115|nr:hypothetical protein [Magnetospirillum sp. UT-4]